MKNLLPLLFLIACADPNAALLADYKHLENENQLLLNKIESARNENLRAWELQEACQSELSQTKIAFAEKELKSVSPKLLALPDSIFKVTLDLTSSYYFFIDGKNVVYHKVIKGSGSSENKNCTLIAQMGSTQWCKKDVCQVFTSDKNYCVGKAE